MRDHLEGELAEGWEKVTREELFTRWPVYEREHERLLKRLDETGSS